MKPLDAHQNPVNAAPFDSNGAALFRGQRALRRRRRTLDVLTVVVIIGLLAGLAISIERLSDDATTINLAGRQRSLTQRIGLLASRLSSQPEAAARQSALQAIDSDVTVLIDHHRRLSAPQRHNYPKTTREALAQAYFGRDTLDDRLQEFIQLVQRLLAAAAPSATPADWTSLAQEITYLASGSIDDPASLLYAQNRVVRLYEVGYQQKLQRYHWLLRASAIAVFLLVVIGSGFVFTPAIRAVERQALRNEHERRHLVESAAHELTRLRTDIDALTEKSAVIDNGEIDARSLQPSIETLRSRATALQNLFATNCALRADERFTATQLLEEVLDEIRARASTDAPPIDVHIREDYEIRNNRRLILRSIVHLVNNAIDYRDPTELVPMVNIYAERSGRDECTITVRDNGIGVPPELRNTLFEPKSAADGFSSIGLSIVRQNIRQCGGDVSYAPVIGGSSFTVRIPTNLDSADGTLTTSGHAQTA
ncbi:MAG: ATP-binding protein [Pseudomonadota bacterium]